MNIQAGLDKNTRDIKFNESVCDERFEHFCKWKESIEKRIGELEDKKQQGIDPFYFSNMVMRVGMDANEKMGELQERIKKLEQTPKPSSPSKEEQTFYCPECNHRSTEPNEHLFGCKSVIRSHQDPSKVSISREVLQNWFDEQNEYTWDNLEKALKQSLQER